MVRHSWVVVFLVQREDHDVVPWYSLHDRTWSDVSKLWFSLFREKIMMWLHGITYSLSDRIWSDVGWLILDVLLLECYSLRFMSHTPVGFSISVLYDYNVPQVTVLLIYVMYSLYSSNMYCRNPPLEDNDLLSFKICR